MNIIVYSETSQIHLVWIITIEVTCVVLNMEKKCHGEESYQGDKSCSPFRNFLAVNTTAAKREDMFSTKLLKVKYILLEVEMQQMVPGVI